MKRLVSIALALLMVLSATSAFAATQNVDQQANKDTPTTKVINIVPGISVDDPGTIKLSISADNPTLIFEKVEGANDDPDYYQLKLTSPATTIDVDFTLVNTSVAGSGTDPFNGWLDIKADCVLKGTQVKEHKNIKVAMNFDKDTTKSVSNATESKANENTEFKLQYSNNAAATTNITDAPTLENIQGNLSVDVTFTITPRTTVPK